METFIELKDFVKNTDFKIQKQKALFDFSDDLIDLPIVDLINGFNRLPFCFTLQSCYGHFLYSGQKDIHNLDTLPVKETIAKVKYRIAYIAFCIENSIPGRWLFEALKEIIAVDPHAIQFCCAEWFWERQVNSYVLQVEPDRFKHKDTAIIDFKEALQIEKIRNTFFIRLDELLDNLIKNI